MITDIGGKRNRKRVRRKERKGDKRKMEIEKREEGKGFTE